MVQVDTRLIVLSSKRSTHHAFLEGVLKGKRFLYHNNVVVTKAGKLSIARTTSAEEPVEAPMVYVASFERQFSLPDIYRSAAFQELEARNPSVDPPRRLVYLRDPLNTLASTYSAHLKTDYFANFNYVTANLRQWVNVARYVLAGLAGETFIYANRFWTDEHYRRSRLSDLDFDSYELSDRLSKFGGGGNTYLGDRKQAITTKDLNARYLTYADDAKFVGMVRENMGLFCEFCEYVRDEATLDALRAF